MRRLLAAALLVVPLAAAGAAPVTVDAVPVSSFHRLFPKTEFGPFSWRGGLTLSAADSSFGGFSGLVLGPSCETLLAVSDRGMWLKARLSYEEGRLSGLGAAELAPMLDSKGRRQRGKVWSDAEAAFRLGDGRTGIAFESRTRFGAYDTAKDGFSARFEPLPHPADIDEGPDNAEVEAFGELPDGRLIAIAEGQFDAAGNIRAWAWKGKKAIRFTLARHDAYVVTDLAVLEDGTVLTLERRFTETALPGMAVRRFPATAISEGGTVVPELLLEATAPLTVIDNMEGIAACTRGSETRITFLSDDNFNRSIQSTVLLQFAYSP